MCVQLQSALSAAVFTVNPTERLDAVFGAEGLWTNQSVVLLCDDGAFCKQVSKRGSSLSGQHISFIKHITTPKENGHSEDADPNQNL